MNAWIARCWAKCANCSDVHLVERRTMQPVPWSRSVHVSCCPACGSSCIAPAAQVPRQIELTEGAAP